MDTQSKLPLVLLLATGLGLISGCDQKPKPAPTAAKPAAVRPLAQGAAPSPTNTDPNLAGWRADEAAVLKSLGQPNARAGSVLSLREGDKVILTIKDEDNQVSVLTAIQHVPTKAGPMTVYEVTEHLVGEVDEPSSVFYDTAGKLIERYSGGGSWRGAILAIPMTDDTFDAEGDSNAHTELRDWSSTPHTKYVFKSRCLATQWVSDAEIKGTCLRPSNTTGTATPTAVRLNGSDEVTDAVFTRTGPNSWRVQELRAPKAKLRDVPNNSAQAYDETVVGVPYTGGN